MRIGYKISGLVAGAALSATAVLTWIGYSTAKRQFIAGVDRQLTAAAAALPGVIGEDYLGRALAEDLPQEEYDRCVHMLSALADRSNVFYLYAFKQDGDRVVHLATSASHAERAAGDWALFFRPYEEPPAELMSTFADGRTRFAEYTDEFGAFRSIFVRYDGPGGRPYVVGVDVTLSGIDADLRALVWRYLGAGAVVTLGLIIALVLFVSVTVTRPILRMRSSVLQIAEGNLDARVEGVTTRDEIGELAESVNQMAENLDNVVGQVRQSSIQLHSTITQLTATSRDQEGTVASFGSSANQIAASVSEISATGNELARTMDQVNEVATETSTLATGGRAGLRDMEATMRSLDEATATVAEKLATINEKASNITGVVNTITKVADQTNLLSVNAAIEAEKAGEYGVGFLVVAREIRRLADQTAAATLDIEQIVQAMESAVSTGVMEMDRFADHVRRSVKDATAIGEQIGRIIEQVDANTASFERINEGMRNQSQGADEINAAMGQLTESATRTTQATREYVQGAADLQDAIAALKSSIAAFEVN